MTQQLIDVLDIAAADAELYGQRLDEALCRAYFAAKEDNATALEDAIADARREDARLRGVMLNVNETLRGIETRPAATSGPYTLTEEEVRELIIALGRGQPDGFSDEDAEKVVEWAKQVRISQEMLTMLIQHRLTVGIGPDGGVLMGLPKGGKP